MLNIYNCHFASVSINLSEGISVEDCFYVVMDQNMNPYVFLLIENKYIKTHINKFSNAYIDDNPTDIYVRIDDVWRTCGCIPRELWGHDVLDKESIDLLKRLL